MNTLKTLVRAYKYHFAFGLVAMALLGVIVISQLGYQGAQPASTSVDVENTREVSTIQLSGNDVSGGIVETTGEVESNNQASLTPERNGVVQRVNADVGKWVSRGQVVVELDTAQVRADLAQAKAALASAQSQAQSSDIQTSNSALTLQDTVESIQTTLDDIKATKVGPLFSDEDELRNFGVSISSGNTTYYIDDRNHNSARSISSRAREARETMEELRIAQEANVELENRVEISEQALISMRELLDVIAQELSNYTADDTSEQSVYGPFQNDISSARSSVNAALTKLRNSSQAYKSAQVNNSQSQIEQAKAQVASAEARFAQGFIRAPFSGEVTAMDVRVGEVVGPSQKVVSLVNKNKLRINVSVSPDAAKRIQVNAPAVVDGSYDGFVSAVSSAINPQTGKVEVHISITDATTDLILNDFVDVRISTNNDPKIITVPFSAVKTTGSGSTVFAIKDGQAVRVPVETGEVVGDAVTIVAGLDGAEEIIARAGTISAGDRVIPRN